MMTPWTRSLLAFAAAAIPSLAVAQEYCVTCTAPDATYRCAIADPRPGVVQSLQLACLTALAKEGGHAQCAVKRGVTVFDCDAPLKRVTLGEGVGADGQPGAPAVLPPPPPPKTDPNAPPSTVLEAMQRAKKASDEQWKQTGDKVKDAGQKTGSFLEKTFTCIGSLFTRCGGAN